MTLGPPDNTGSCPHLEIFHFLASAKPGCRGRWPLTGPRDQDVGISVGRSRAAVLSLRTDCLLRLGLSMFLRSPQAVLVYLLLTVCLRMVQKPGHHGTDGSVGRLPLTGSPLGVWLTSEHGWVAFYFGKTRWLARVGDTLCV